MKLQAPTASPYGGRSLGGRPAGPRSARVGVGGWLLLLVLFAFVGAEVVARIAEPRDLDKTRATVRVAARCAHFHPPGATPAVHGYDLPGQAAFTPIPEPSLSSSAAAVPVPGMPRAAAPWRAYRPRSPPFAV